MPQRQQCAVQYAVNSTTVRSSAGERRALKLGGQVGRTGPADWLRLVRMAFPATARKTPHHTTPHHTAPHRTKPHQTSTLPKLQNTAQPRSLTTSSDFEFAQRAGSDWRRNIAHNPRYHLVHTPSRLRQAKEGAGCSRHGGGD